MLPAPVSLSLVLPAYNEAARLPRYLATVKEYLGRRYGGQYEVLVVDDGSTDDMPALLARWGADWPQLTTIRQQPHRGKGAAVAAGVMAAQGELVLFADADGATPIEELARLAEAIRAGAEVAVGSRLLRAEGAVRRRKWLRGAAGRTYAALARRVLRLAVRDTQCGFKMFRGTAAKRLFGALEESGYLFDLEILARATQLGYAVVEVPIRWSEIPGGHFHPLRELPGMLAGLWRLRRRAAPADRVARRCC